MLLDELREKKTPSSRLATNSGPGISVCLGLLHVMKSGPIATSIFWWTSLGVMTSSVSDYRWPSDLHSY